VLWAFADVDPDVAGEVSRLDGEGGPGFSSVRVTVYISAPTPSLPKAFSLPFISRTTPK
jgi:hypothetical protein